MPFIADRSKKHCSIFRTRVLGRDTAVISGPALRTVPRRGKDSARGRDAHKRPGADYATIAMQIFVSSMLRSYDWSLPPRRLELDASVTPPLPKDGLRAKVTKRA